MEDTYKHLDCTERAVIQVGLEQGHSLRSISQSLSRSVSTVSRELQRNHWKPPSSRSGRRGRRPVAGGYRATRAEHRARQLAHKPRKDKRLIPGNALWSKVVSLLQTGNSPEQVSGTLKRMHPKEPQFQISHETIYTAIYTMPRGELRKEVISLLRQSRKKRRPRSRGEDRRGSLPNMVSIHERPPEVDERLVPGHWEGDLIKGARNASAVGTLVERTSLFVALAKVDNGSAESAQKGFSYVLNRIDAQRRLSMTYDQGKEMACHEILSEKTGIKVYFADPHSPWQRGINENTNGLLRQYLPKSTDLSAFSQEELDQIALKLNARPRKSLDWKCPAEIFLPDFDFREYYGRILEPVALRT
ncbi:IS30 family transposase [Geopsychrobacter electrodiphilus]|uniref:IS30 family transposase n=1 Tax=Geopsychrobacter electrodiphilus TaxID=225196 RepID=UPI00035E41B8|nr:IS30 family transposase [Geopsychrobacter electrodiphilus]